MTQNSLGVFDSNSDIGDVGATGSSRFDGSVYEVTGSGQNIWFAEDAFHFVWTRVEGDVSLSADIAFVGDGVDAHRKACLMVRQSLEPGSSYADIALHGDGLTSLQFRPEDGVDTLEFQSPTTWPATLGLHLVGTTVTVIVDGVAMQDTADLALQAPYYVGLAVASHAKGILEAATFSNVALEATKVG